jgi:hypothetical protein
MVSLSLSGSIRVIDETQQQGELYYRAQVAMERISEDLVSAVLPADVEFIGSRGENSTDATDELSFASLAHVVFDPTNGRTGMGIIQYTVQPDKENDQQLLLLRTDVLYRPQEKEQAVTEDGEAFLLCDRLRSVRFSFIDRNGETVETWNTTVEDGADGTKRQLPAAVSCRLEFWLNQEEETSLSFETTVLLPVGLIQVEKSGES